MEINIPGDEAKKFREFKATPDYLREERSYKQALSAVVRPLLAAEQLQNPRFPQLLKGVLDGEPDYNGLGISPPEASSIRGMFKASEVAGSRAALANLSGGRWGATQLQWISRAVDFGLGPEIQKAFRLLVDSTAPVAQRVDQFREDLYATQLALRDKPDGFLPGWRGVPVSLNFIGAVLGSFDPTRYTFYAATLLRAAVLDYGLQWPSVSAGEKYAFICDFMVAIQSGLRAAGVATEDLIDAQSFVWTRRRLEPPQPGDSKTSATVRPRVGLDLELVAAALAEATFWDRARARNLVKLALRRRELLFHGPPGTGKTYVAQKLAELLSEEQEDRVEKVQFHPSYAYEDFIEGIRPKLTQSDLGFTIRPGIFRKLIEAAQPYEKTSEPFFLIIDEINRANLPRVLGELLYALEYRGKKNPITLPYSDKTIYVPTNLTIIATMNSADRSIALVDAAIRRRFAHVRFKPDLEALRSWLKSPDHGCEAFADDAVSRLQSLNAELLRTLDEDRLIGHSFLMRDLREVSYETIWDEDLEPVLREHLLGHLDELGRMRTIFLKEHSPSSS